MSVNVKSYFESHAHDYPKHIGFYSAIIDQIREVVPQKGDIKFLDVGCGNGNFIKVLINSGMKAEYYATDISFKMARISVQNLDGCNVKIVVADGFKLPLRPDMKFDVIHLDSVLHHLIGKTKGNSTSLVRQLVQILAGRLQDSGIMIVEEICYSSYIVPTFTSRIIFYGLKMINSLNFDLSRLNKQIKLGLEVNFLHEKELVEILNKQGSTYLINKDPYKVSNLYKLTLLKQFGHFTYIVKRISRI